MTNRQIALKLVTQYLDVPAHQSSFDDRLILQKAIYLVQQAGVDLNYRYTWYLRGPYCSDLTRDAYEMLSEPDIQGWNIGPTYQAILKRFHALTDKLKKEESGDPAVRRFERYASILFAITTGQATDDNDGMIRDLMHRAGKEYSIQEIKATIDDLRTYGLLQQSI